jgi:hypothetical protein
VTYPAKLSEQKRWVDSNKNRGGKRESGRQGTKNKSGLSFIIYCTTCIRVGRRATQEIECWWAESETRCLPSIIIIVVSNSAGSCHSDSRDRDDNLLALTLDVTTPSARHISVDGLEDRRGLSNNDLLLWLSVGVTWLHARQHARRIRGIVDEEALINGVSEDVDELIALLHNDALDVILAAKVGVDLELQLLGAALGDEGLQEVGYGLVGLAEGLDQVDGEVLVAVAVEGGCEAAVADAGGATCGGRLVRDWES